jgi:hypothetical protein
MKKKAITLIFTILIMSTGIASHAAAQAGANGDFSDTRLAGAGMFLSYSYGFLGTRSLSIPPITGYYEFGVHEYITAGPFASFARWNYRYAGWNYSWSFFQLGGRGSFHLTSFLNDTFDGNIDEEKWDLYITMLAGLEFRGYDGGSAVDPTSYHNRTRLFLGPVAGARYYFNDNMAVFLEGGAGSLGALLLGVSARL